MYYIPIWWHYLRAKREVKQKSRKPLICKNLRLLFLKSGRQDLNLRPLAPQASALARLRHAPSPRRTLWLIASTDRRVKES